MLTPQPVLIIGSEPRNLEELDRAFGKYGLRTAHCETIKVARKLIQGQLFSAVYCEENLADGSYREIIREVARSSAGTPVIVVSSRRDWEAHVAAILEGAFDCLGLPLNQEELERIMLLVLDKCGKPEEHWAHAAG
jgi:DNA-binding NtrC family response regulator